ncbi:MAG: carboxypeptidase regulatory-like domain-containing protein [Acidobacteriaceae bacterium]|nr:carboxypeptidase regulatory-like domain-containing protein [Acidobacteriaceae bacterium]MBV9781383.1 carboxypeptidase regulatory-like domain-containing protein [Acidobacteriaceae bacterium]
MRLTVAAFAIISTCTFSAWAQQGSEGTVTVTVTDPSGAVIPEAKLELRDLASNYVRQAATQSGGTYSFVNLPIGTYRLEVSKEGFNKQVFDSVTVQAARVTDISAKLLVGSTTQTVEVAGGEVPVIETTSNMIGTTIDMKQIEDLPLFGRDLTQLSTLTPGYNGTWNGLPSVDQGNNVDGVIGSPTRMKFTGNAAPIVSPRLENIAEMTVQTDQLDLNQGFGQSSMQLNFVTRRGSNQFHGRAYEDFQNSVLNANSWYNDAAGLSKPHLELNNFGGSVGGRVIRDKLFFFGSYSMSKQPGSFVTSTGVMNSATETGNFTYIGADGVVHTVNVLNIAHAFNPSLPGTINPVIASELQAINGSLRYGSVTPTSDPNISTLSWLQPSPTTFYYPTFRVDYNISDKLRLNVSYNQTKETQPAVTPSFLPGPTFSNEIAGNRNNNYTAGVGLDWTISPTLINEFRGGFLYNATWYAYNAAPLYATSPGAVNWNLPTPANITVTSGAAFNLPITTYYPVFNASDNLTWQRGKHTMKYGFSWYREQDHYWNAPAGWPSFNLGLATGDPALNALTSATIPGASPSQLAEAQQLYAVLTGRLSGVSGQYAVDPKTKSYIQRPGSLYALDELMSAWGLFGQDSYHVRPNLTVNYGLRWDFTGDNHDLTNNYRSATPDAIYGPTPIGHLFAPGDLGGNANPMLIARAHQYNGWNVAPQPAIGIAWVPDFKEGILGKLTGGKTVIRAGYSLRRFTEPQQYFWNQATDYGSFYYQNFNLLANNTGNPGTFAPGSLSLGNALPPYTFTPATFSTSSPESEFTFLPLTYLGNEVNGLNPNIKQPYTQSWNFGIQREVPGGGVLELRYNGNRTIHQWISVNTNEVNVFENGFLNQFRAAQQNYNINQRHGISSFADNGYAGQQPTPIFNAAFAGEGSGGPGVPLADYGNGQFITWLTSGQVGALANVLAGANYNPFYFCNLVGSSFGPCATTGGFTGPGAGYPINFFQANPFSAGQPVYNMDELGYSNYNALQVDFRQRAWHGVQFDANYTWSHTLGIETPNNWTSQSPQYTLRDLRMSYGPTLFDIRHVVHANATVDLPFGKGRHWMDRGGILNAVLGGWTAGDIFTFQTGAPFLLTGGNSTFNDYADGGVILNGITASQLQNSVGVYRIPAVNGSAATFVDLINPKYLVSPSGGGANPAYILPNTTPGTIADIIWLHGPHQTFNDMSLSKRFPITERIHFILQGEFLNIFNHPVFAENVAYGPGGIPASNVQNTNFGTGGIANGARVIELRANIEF